MVKVVVIQNQKDVYKRQVLHQQIVKETSDRQNAVNGLQQNITQEAQNRQNADTVLQNNIDNEKETRIAQDEILDSALPT